MSKRQALRAFPALALLLCLLLAALPAAALSAESDTHKLVLVNYEHWLGADYVVENLGPVKGAVFNTVRLPAYTAERYYEMRDALFAAGLRDIAVNSGYRSYQRQTELFNAYLAEYRGYGYSEAAAYAEVASWCALPGQSEHQSGFTLDISTGGSMTDISQTPVARWLGENCWDYGFIVRYPANKVDITRITYEPWHFRYVGLPHSKLMRARDQCLEEYIEALPRERRLTYTDEAGGLYEVFWHPTNVPSPAWLCRGALIDRSTDNCGGVVLTLYHPDGQPAYAADRFSPARYRALYQTGAAPLYSPAYAALYRLPLPAHSLPSAPAPAEKATK